LRSLFIYHTFNLQGDAIVSFCGACDVSLNNMVDQEDVKLKAPIYSRSMLHFLGEFFDDDLEKTILRQRLLMASILECLRKEASSVPWMRAGDDIYVGKLKVSVSIATKSPVSTLIHAGINIETKDTPVPTFGLEQANVDPKVLSGEVLFRFKEEMEGIGLARCKVRGVP